MLPPRSSSRSWFRSRRRRRRPRRSHPPQLVFVEPFVLFNFGQATTSLPGADRQRALVSLLRPDVAGEEAVVAHAVAAAERDDAAMMATEFGATMDPSTLRRMTGQLDGAMVPWIFWAYEE